nr:hypothetical protein [uncultured Flavobacterium sp.]
MKRINSEEDFLNEIKNTDIITNTIFEFPHVTVSGILKDLTFDNCIFKTKFLHLYNIDGQDNSITFRECDFEGRLEVSHTTLYSLSLENINSLERLYIHGNNNATIGNFKFKNEHDKNERPLDTRIEIQNYIFKSFEFFNVNHIGQHFKFFGNVIGLENKKFSFERQTIGSSWITNAMFLNNSFFEDISFFRTVFLQNKEKWDNYYHGTFFEGNTFCSVDFENTSFSESCIFLNCTFNGRINFPNANNYSVGNLSFNECKFNEHSDFQYTQVLQLSFYLCVFEKTVSFSDTIVESVYLTRNIFNKSAHFDDFTIKKIKECGRTTLRTIKQELQKADNKIDYNRFRAYELAAYYRELKFHKNFVDKTILGLTILFTGYNYNWFRALTVTVLTGMLFYSILYFIEFYRIINPDNENNFTSGAFRFFLVTDFFSPFLERKYLNNGYSWTVFVLGKIFIAFGIYEMIQAFRKFKA